MDPTVSDSRAQAAPVGSTAGGAEANPSTGPFLQTPANGTTDGSPETALEDATTFQPRAAFGRMGNYELIAELTAGGMGVIYRARHTVLGRIDALKTMRVETQGDPSLAARFQREVRAGAQLLHRHIVPIHEVGEHNGQLYYSMPLISGGSLAQRRGRLTGDARAVAALLEKIARAVQYAHDYGVVHRDLKPSNILLDEQGEPLVADFGLAKFRDGDLELTRAGTSLGTPAYMAPEQAAGRINSIGPRADIWALGVILYELLVGRRPFTGTDTEAVRRQILETDPPCPRSLCPQMDQALETVTLKCLEKDPAARYASAGALADDLGCWLRGEPTRAQPDRLPRRTWRRIRRHPRVVAGLMLFGLLAAAASVWLDVTDPDRPLKIMQRELTAGREVLLIGDKGGPRWSRWIIEGRCLANQENLVVQSWKLSLLELMTDPKLERYRLSAEVYHRADNQLPGAAVGIYFARDYAAPSHFYYGFRFNDRQDLARLRPLLRGNSPALTFERYRPLDDLRDMHEFAHRCYFKPAAQDKPCWRKLVIEVHPDAVRTYWGEERTLAGECLRSELDASLSSLFHDAANIPLPRMGPRGGFGLYVHMGEASFRNFRIEPLPSE